MKRAALLATILGGAAILRAQCAQAAPSLGSLALATGWLGGHPTLASLRGRVVLLDVFTFECVNCTNVTPALKNLYAAYPRSELEIVAVHTPEVPSYQKAIGYVARQRQAAALPWPIALDNEHRIWDAYGVSAWPTQLIFDRAGHLRYTIVGEGQDRHVAAAVRSLVHGFMVS
ncbi:MAG TPA: redoxin domain-containing protein [Candidatus Sulfotelmatobacter sp.]|nr:redoxin domain-containing protein [Candidatus Sulfotelmatobacter sp.]